MWIVLASSLVLAPAACTKKDKDEDRDEEEDDEDSGKKKKKKDKDDDEDFEGRGLAGEEGKKSASASPPAGAVLDYMPADCPGGRFYINTNALFSDSASQNVLREITTKILAKQRDPNAGKVVDVLKKSGFDLATGVRELAMCQQANNEPVIGIALTVANTLGLLKDMAVAVGEPAPAISEKNGAKILATGKVTFAQPMAGVVVLGEPAAIDSALQKKGGDGFADARGQVAWLMMPVKNEGTAKVKITRAATNLNLWASMQFTGEVADAMKQDPAKFDSAMRQKALEASAELKSTPYALVDQRAQNATFQTQGDTLVVTLSIPTEDITALLKAAAPELGVSVDGSGAPPTTSGDGVDPLDELLKMMKKPK